MSDDYEQRALEYHSRDTVGKTEIQLTKPLDTQDDLCLAYSPGVAGPCRAIAEDVDASFKYTARGNRVGVISNGTAVLGLGNIGPYASKPVMEGKAMLFKKFANIDVFDIEVDAVDPDEFIACVKALEPTFGGVNLEDIKAPECFYIEETLRKQMKIPVFHDDQHGTAIIAAAAFLNAIELTKRKIKKTRVVFSGAGAAAIACASLFRTLGVLPENLIMCDSKGVIHKGRDGLNPYKEKFAHPSTKATNLAEALVGADVFVGVSQAGVLTPEMLKEMEANPIIFALANPNPEIMPNVARATRNDAIIATGRSDFPNQVNNVLGFPYIFRGALDVRATEINEEMKLAAVKAIASLAREDVPEDVLAVYKARSRYEFGRDYLIPKPVDQRVLLRVAPAVAEAAMKTGVARRKIDIASYREKLQRFLGPTRRLIRSLRKEIVSKKVKNKPRIVVCNGEDPRILKAVKQVHDNGEIEIILLGNVDKIYTQAESLGLKSLEGIDCVDPLIDSRCDDYAQILFELRKRKGISKIEASQVIHSHDYFASVMLHSGQAHGMVSGVVKPYAASLKPLLEVVGNKKGSTLAGVYLLVREQQMTFLADCTVNIDPSPEQLANVAVCTAEIAARYTDVPIRAAMLSFTSFGSVRAGSPQKVSKAVKILSEMSVNFEFDGEMQADVALDKGLRDLEFPFCNLKGNANVLIFPDLNSANISYKLLTHLGGLTPTGPILVGLNKPANVLQRSAGVQEIANMIYLTAHQASC